MSEERVEPDEVVSGMEVEDADGVRIGRVVEVRATELLIHRPVGGAARLPRSALAAIHDGRAVLRGSGAELLSSGRLLPLSVAEPGTVGAGGEGEDGPVGGSPPLPPPHWDEQVTLGMVVLTRDGVELGAVKAIEAERLLIDRPLARDSWFPARYIDHAGGEAVILRLSQRELDALG